MIRVSVKIILSKVNEQELLIDVYFDFETWENAILIVLGKVSINSRCAEIFAQFLSINFLVFTYRFNKPGFFRRSTGQGRSLVLDLQICNMMPYMHETCMGIYY